MACNVRLKPMQEGLILQRANSLRSNSIDEDSIFTRYLNCPTRFTLGGEVRKAAFSLANMIDGLGTRVLEEDQALGQELFTGCKGLLFVTVAKVAFLGGVRFGTGLVLSRSKSRPFGWSAPCAILLGGFTVGVQFGAQVVDLVVPLLDETLLDHFSQPGGAHLAAGSEIAVALGPVGRSAEASVIASAAGLGTAVSWSQSRGIYAGVTLDGAVVRVRGDVNRSFYGRDVDPCDLFSEAIKPPRAAGNKIDTEHASR